MSDRGDYRSFYVSMLDDPDFRDMPGDDFKIFFALRLTLGAAGIGVLRRLVLCDQLKISTAKLEKRLASLEKPKPESGLGWIVWDRRNDIVWIVNALKYEPSLSSKNERQRKHINGLVKPLSPHSNAVKEFWKTYPDWRIGAETEPTAPPTIVKGNDTPTDSPPNGQGMGIDSPAKHKRRETRDGDERPATGDIRQATDENISDSDKPPLDRFVDRFYVNAKPERRAEIVRQLNQALQPEGVRVRTGVTVRAKSQAHLNRCISAVLRGTPPANPDSAIVFVFKKLEDPEKDSAGNVGTEIADAKNRHDVLMAERYHRARRAAAKPWGEEHPEELEKFERMAKVTCGTSGMAETARKAFVLQRIAEAIDFPEFEAWAEAQTAQAVPA